MRSWPDCEIPLAKAGPDVIAASGVGIGIVLEQTGAEKVGVRSTA